MAPRTNSLPFRHIRSCRNTLTRSRRRTTQSLHPHRRAAALAVARKRHYQRSLLTDSNPNSAKLTFSDHFIASSLPLPIPLLSPPPHSSPNPAAPPAGGSVNSAAETFVRPSARVRISITRERPTPPQSSADPPPAHSPADCLAPITGFKLRSKSSPCDLRPTRPWKFTFNTIRMPR
ncbi:hypothetical protein CDAR_119991 [Caerostris darwini]|uniref:Uncharacterized protein n=1 Tax=Caerostris darwini TaxID=1538125 RepID=A0AAV4T5B8_9ARAC|nr:hypothetical protein CDAR_119991 [Caerostris darwini]